MSAFARFSQAVGMPTRLRERAQSMQLGQFLWCWMQNPASVGALVPSGRALAALMAQGISPGARVVELGAGTGTVTEAILEAGVRPEDLDIVEKEWPFIASLQAKYAGVQVHQADALQVGRRLCYLGGSVDFVVSGLPLLLFSRAQRMRILRGAFTLLKSGGALHQFTYAARCPIDPDMLRKLGLKAARIGIAARNIPPAFVFKIYRAPLS